MSRRSKRDKNWGSCKGATCSAWGKCDLRCTRPSAASAGSDEKFRLHQGLTKAAIAYVNVLSSGADFDATMRAAQELEDAADAWAAR